MNGGSPQDVLGALLRETTRAMLSRIEPLICTSGLAFSQWLALKLIASGRITCVGDVQREVGIETGASTRLIDQLESKGLIERRRQRDDRRVVTVVVTTAGDDMIASVQPLLGDFWINQLAAFSIEEQHKLVDLLTRLRDGMGLRPAAASADWQCSDAA